LLVNRVVIVNVSIVARRSDGLAVLAVIVIGRLIALIASFYARSTIVGFVVRRVIYLLGYIASFGLLDILQFDKVGSELLINTLLGYIIDVNAL
jgi:hypothetical protein